MSNKYKILIVEDENNIRSFIETTLAANGYQVLGADSCRDGIMMFASHVPDLVILDLGLPDADGKGKSDSPKQGTEYGYGSGYDW